MTWLARRIIAGVEAVIYGPPSVVSGWFEDDPGYCGRDPLADRTESVVETRIRT